METVNWNAEISMVLKALSDAGEAESASVIRNGKLDVDVNACDNWNGGTTYYDVVFRLKYKEYVALEQRKSELEGLLDKTIERFHTDERSAIANVIILPEVEQLLDWQAVYPITKDDVIQLINQERQQLEKNATGEQQYKDDGVESEYESRHKRICQIAKKVRFEYPIEYDSLAEWWTFVKNIGGYAERRTYISQIFSPLISALRESEEGEVVDFSRIATKTETIHKAINDVEVFIRDGEFASAVDRVHTAFHGYMRSLLDDHQIPYTEAETLSQLYSKLHAFYGNTIHPTEVAELVRTVLRSSSGIISSINDLCNRHTVAHPNEKLIERREALLVMKLTNAMIEYIEDIEETKK